MWVLCQTQNSRVRYAPLYIHSFPLCVPRKILEATQFNQQYHSYREIQNIPDRLRWCRHSKGLRQIDVAEKLGISLSVYKSIEKGITQHVSQELAQDLARLYGVPATDFLDDYYCFLKNGQAQYIQAYRKQLGMGRKKFAKYTGIPLTSIRAWECGEKIISRKSWERYFRGRT